MIMMQFPIFESNKVLLESIIISSTFIYIKLVNKQSKDCR